MDRLPSHAHAEIWIAEIFSAKAARSGGVVRRSAAWVEREVGRDRLIAEVQQRRFHMIECGGQFG